MADQLGDDWWQKSTKNKAIAKDKKKRKRDEDVEVVDILKSSEDKQLIQKPAKKKLKPEIKEVVESDVEEQKGIDSKSKKHKKKKAKAFEGNVISTPESMIEVIDKHFTELSAVEKNLIELKEDNFSTCNDGSHTIASFIKTLFPKWKKALKSNDGLPRKPVVVIVCSSALRCVEVIKQMSDLKSNKCIIAKLFAKHMKLEETQAFLKSKTIHVAVGTPNRLQSLISSGDLLLDSVQQVILDVTHKDVKKCTIFDIKIVKSDLMKLLSDCVIPHVKETSCKMALF